jgi:hypothetical protein
MPKNNGVTPKTTHFEQIPLKVVPKMATALDRAGPAAANTVQPARPTKE